MKPILLLLLGLTAANAANIFDNIKMFENALVPAGFPVTKWQPISNQYSGSSQIILPKSQHAVISYAFMGTTARRVTRANISTLINAKSDAPRANAKLAEVTTQWFKAMGKKAPNELLAAIRNGKEFTTTINEIKATVTRQADDTIVRLDPKK